MSHDVLTEVQFWAQVLTDSERTIICSPDNESRIKSWIDGRCLAGLLTVAVSPHLRDTELFVIDEHAIEASTRRALQEGTHEAIRRLVARTDSMLAAKARHWLAAQVADPRDAIRLTNL